MRGGARLVFTAMDITFNVAHYYTYLDVPGTQFRLPGQMRTGSNTARFANPVLAFQRFPRVAITGGSFTFPITKLYTIVRGELAYFSGRAVEPPGQGQQLRRFDIGTGIGTPGTKRLRSFNNTEGGVNPFVYPRFLAIGRKDPLWGTVLQRNSFNMSIGFDINRYIRFLNPTQTFFFSTQFFYKHVFNSPGDLVLPVPFRNLPVSSTLPIIGNPNDPNNPLGRLGGGCGPKVKGAPKGRAVPAPARAPATCSPASIPCRTTASCRRCSSPRLVLGRPHRPVFGIFYDWVGSGCPARRHLGARPVPVHDGLHVGHRGGGAAVRRRPRQGQRAVPGRIRVLLIPAGGRCAA